MPAARRAATDFLRAIPGETAALVRDHDWAATPLGPIEGWPQSLKSVVATMMAAPGPMVLLWGEQGTLIYNDGYARFAGRRHPQLLGMGAREGWPEIADFNDGNIKRGLAGEAWSLKNQELVLDRSGRLESGWMDLDYVPVRDESGEPAGVLVIVTETTWRIEAERRAAAESERQRRMLQQMPGFVAMMEGPEHRFGYVNEAYANITGHRDYIGRTAREVYPDLEGQGLFEMLDEVYRSGEPVTVRNAPVTLREGDRVVDFVQQPLLDADGQVCGIFTVGYDQTDAHATQAALRESEARYRTLFESVETGFCIVQMKFDQNDVATDYMIVEANPAFEELTGLHDADGKWVSEIAPGLERHWFDTYGRVALTGEPERFENHADIFGRWYDVEALRIGEPAQRRVAILFTDMTARKLLERRQKALIALDDAVVDLDDPEEIGFASARVLGEALGASRVAYGVIEADAGAITVERDWTAPGQRSVAGRHLFSDYGSHFDDLRLGRSVSIADVTEDPHTAADPKRLLELGIHALLDVPLIEQGRTVAQVLVHSDRPRAWTAEEADFVREFAERTRVLVARREAERTVRERQQELQRLADSLPLLVSRVDRDLRYAFNNRAYETWFGMTPDAMKGRHVREVIGEAAFEKLRPNLERALAGERLSLEQVSPYNTGTRHTRVDYVPSLDAAGRPDGFYAIVQDIGEQKRAEAAIRESEARLRFLDELSQATAGLTDADEVMAVTCRLTARHLGVTNCAYADMDPDQDGFSIRGDWAAPGAPHITGHYSLADFGKLAVQELGAGRPLIINDNLKEIDPDEAATFQAIGISATICMPLVKEGRLAALMAIHHAQPHVWTDAELSTLREVTERSWAHVERVGAQAALQESEGRQAFLLKLADALRPLTDPEAVIDVATRMIAERIDADRVGYAEDEPEDGAISVRADHVREGASLRGRYRYEDYGAELLARFRRGETVIRPDIANDLGLSEAEKAAHATLGLGATINVPLLINGRLRAVMFAHWKQAHDISPTLAALIEGAAERVRSAFDRVSAESARQISQSRYQALFDAIDEGFCIIEFIDGPEGPLSDYIHVEANAAYVDNAGIPDVVGQKVREMVPDEAQGWIDLYKTVLDTGQPIRFEKELQATARWLELAAFRVEPAERNQVAVLFKDLTARKLAERALERMNEQLEERVEERTGELMAAEEALRQAQKMEAVGQLTGGIAHDFNNLLAGISGALELLSKRMAEGRTAGMERYIEAAQGSAQRAAALTQRLLAFSRRQTLDPRPTDVNRLVGGMEDLIRRSVGPNVQVEVVGAGGLWPVQIDQPQLENALLNLCINARDAMAPDGGRLTIETANKWLDDRHARDREIPPGQYVSLCVTDTGTGMSPEVIARIFDPFFTTKPLGQGTGLGLSMIHGFVRQSGGQVRVYSEPGDGTTMCLYLPRYMGEVETLDPLVDAEVAEGGHGETVLVIDDEETVRMLVTEVLREAGYRVIGAGDGPSGLEILRSDARIDLLITDVGLPGGMNGRQVADAARESRPDLKVLFITGYAENAAVGNGLLDAGMQVMTKPFVMSDLALKVHEMVEG